MLPIRITKVAAGLHVGLVVAAAYYTMRINNHASLADVSLREASVMAAMVLLPIVFAWGGLRLARGRAARWMVAAGQSVALLAFAGTFVAVLRSVEPMAPLLLFLVSLWLAAGLAVVLVAVWLAGRWTR